MKRNGLNKISNFYQKCLKNREIISMNYTLDYRILLDQQIFCFKIYLKRELPPYINFKCS